MQCPTCGTNTPGTLGKCPNCDAPIDQPGVPLGAPVPMADPAAPPKADAQAIGDKTLFVPPPKPSWASDSDSEPSGPPEDSDGETTAQWTINLADSNDSGGFQAAPPPPPPAPPAAPGGFGGGTPEGGGAESIVPESWFARPRKPDEQDQDPGFQQWAPQPPAPGAMGEATMVDSPYPGPGAPAEATRFDQPGMNMGVPMGPSDPTLGPPMSPYMGPGPGGMPDYPPPPGSSGKASKPLLIAVVALVAVAVVSVGLVLWPDGEKKAPPVAKPTPSPSNNTQVAQKKPIAAGRQQAVEVNKLLNASADTKRQLSAALNGTRKCETLPTAIKGFQVVAQRRTNQIRRTQSLQLDQLRNGDRMRVSLRQAFQASLEADQRLYAWANVVSRKCRGKPRPDVSRAPGRAAAERRATTAKKQFVAMWNPVAKNNSLPPRIWNGL
ncbi:hypothetical protein GCM10010191_44010 [Actinomadura vinacea]|uniref:Zinc ribbon domain-containing protein n=1 Tax=Actinomadura vinacea TaxID=115336 RepID=A0ABN3JEB9_9ACTN